MIVVFKHEIINFGLKTHCWGIIGMVAAICSVRERAGRLETIIFQPKIIIFQGKFSKFLQFQSKIQAQNPGRLVDGTLPVE